MLLKYRDRGNGCFQHCIWPLETKKKKKKKKKTGRTRLDFWGTQKLKQHWENGLVVNIFIIVFFQFVLFFLQKYCVVPIDGANDAC
jgi:hypothetical protein